MESKLNGQTDSNSNYSTHLLVMHNFDTKYLNIVTLNYSSYDFDLHIFQYKIDIAFFGRFLRLKFSQQPRHDFAYIVPVAAQCLLKKYTI